METNKYFEGIEELVDYYQFPSDAPSTTFAKGYNLAFFVSDFLNRLTNATHPKFSQLEECRELIRFLTKCKGCEITMIGKIDLGGGKITKIPAQFKDWNFLGTLQAIASFEADRLERLFNKNCIQKGETLSGNKLLGEYADELLFYIEGFNFGEISQTKKYSFIYDALRLADVLAGNTQAVIITEEGFDSDIGHEKSKKVYEWLKAYKKHKNKQND